MAGLGAKEKNYLLEMARSAIASRLRDAEFSIPKPPSEILLEKRGVFVTLTIKGRLRGCIGYLEPLKSIVQAVSENAQNAAFEDGRFLPLKQSELDKIKIEISVLSPLEEIHPKNPEELLKILKPDVHGLIIRKGWAGATFLPQVWEELPTHSQFLSNLCNKAGLPDDEWKRPGMKFFIYTVEKFEE